MGSNQGLRVIGGILGGAAAGVAVGLGVAAIVDAVAKANVPKTVPPFSKPAHEADWIFYRGLARLADDRTKPWLLRQRARIGAAKYKQYWLDAGKAGCNIEPGFQRRAYGNWCGANCGGGEPVDEIDELCRQHDLARRSAFG